MAAAFQGLRVVEFAEMISGPYCGKLRADLGADVLIDNHTPDVLEDLGLGWDALHDLNSSLVHVSITPYGRTGPRSGARGDELTLIHASGLANLLPTRSVDISRAPVKMGGCQVGYHGAVAAALATLRAVIGPIATLEDVLKNPQYAAREFFVEVSHPDVGTHRHAGLLFRMSVSPPKVSGPAPRLGQHNDELRWIALEVHADEEFCRFTEVMAMPELARDDRFRTMPQRKGNEAELDRIIEAWTSQRDRDWMVAQFAHAGLMAAPSRDARDLYADPHLQARGAFVTIDHPELGELELVAPPWKMSDCEMPARCAPLLGAHTDQVLSGILGMSAADLATLRGSGIIL